MGKDCNVCYAVCDTEWELDKHKEWHEKLRELIRSLILFPSSVVINEKVKEI